MSFKKFKFLSNNSDYGSDEGSPIEAPNYGSDEGSPIESPLMYLSDGCSNLNYTIDKHDMDEPTLDLEEDSYSFLNSNNNSNSNNKFYKQFNNNKKESSEDDDIEAMIAMFEEENNEDLTVTPSGGDFDGFPTSSPKNK